MFISEIDTNKDLDQIKALADSAFSITPDSDLSEWFSFEEMIKMIKEERGICLKAADENKTLGMLYAQVENPINGKEGFDKWVIVIAAVSPEAKGKGVGSELLRQMEEEVKKRNATKLFVYTNKDDEEVINFYRKNGYEDAGWIRDYQYGKDNSAVFLLKYI